MGYLGYSVQSIPTQVHYQLIRIIHEKYDATEQGREELGIVCSGLFAEGLQERDGGLKSKKKKRSNFDLKNTNIYISRAFFYNLFNFQVLFAYFLFNLHSFSKLTLLMPAVGCLVAAISSSIIVLTPTSSSTDNTRLDAPSSSYEQTERLKTHQETRITMVL